MATHERGWLYVLLATSLWIALAGQTLAASRVALVIGNTEYQHTSRLKNPRNDAAAVSGVLKRLGFEVLEGTNLDEPAFRRIVRAFAVRMDGAEVALFFYAGHGLQVGGKNYLLPTTAKLDRELDLEFETVPLDLIMTQMERGQRTNIVLLDACRNNPLAEDLARSMGTRSAALGRGLARVETGVGTYVGFSTQPGNVALDGEGDNSPFAAALVRNIETPGLEIETLMRKVREDVIRSTGGRQVPWGNSSLVGAGFVFKAALATDTDGVEAAAREPTSTDRANLEIAYWNSIKDNGDAALLEAYLSEYPNGRFARLADIMIENLTAREKTTAAGKSERANEPVKQATVEPKEQPSATDPEEAGFWFAVKGSNDPKLVRTYLKRYPEGEFVKDAKALLDGLAKQREAAVSPVEEPEPKRPVKPSLKAKLKKPKPPVAEKKKPPAKVKAVKVEKPKKKAATLASKPKVQPAPALKRPETGSACIPDREKAFGRCGSGG